jgi:hypothetical protein
MAHDARPFPAPSICRNEPSETLFYDVLLVSDYSLVGGAASSDIEVISAANRQSFRVACFHWPLDALNCKRQLDANDKPVVWRWQARFMAEGVAGLPRDKTRKPGKRPLPVAIVQRMVDLALSAPPAEATHWIGGAGAEASPLAQKSLLFLSPATRY